MKELENMKIKKKIYKKRFAILPKYCRYCENYLLFEKYVTWKGALGNKKTSCIECAKEIFDYE